MITSTGRPGQYGIEDVISGALVHPDYRKTVAHLRADETRLAVQCSALHFTDYAFEPASVFPAGLVQPEQIAEINLQSSCHVRLKSGEILFVRPVYKEEFVTFVNRHQLPVRRRSSVWSALLDPFLDTWEEQQVIDRQFEWFARLGLDRDAVTRWRREVAVAMLAYNFGAHVWEWVRLDLHDALVAQRARLNRSAFTDFYARAMTVAAIDPVSTYWGSNPTKSVDSALFSVLLAWYPRDNSPASKERQGQIDRRKHSLLTDLTAAYSQPHRRYHTFTHIEHCLGELNCAWDYAVHLEELRWALIFHDAVYDPHRDDNEVCSADWACRVMEELCRPEEERARVRGLILATAHTSEPRTADEALLLDIDLSILGADEATFDEYDRSIRGEYEFVPETRYREARAEVLMSFLRRERIYRTSLYSERLESRARANLQRALARLRTG